MSKVVNPNVDDVAGIINIELKLLFLSAQSSADVINLLARHHHILYLKEGSPALSPEAVLCTYKVLHIYHFGSLRELFVD